MTASSRTRSTLSDTLTMISKPDGAFVITNLAPASYEVKGELTGLSPTVFPQMPLAVATRPVAITYA